VPSYAARIALGLALVAASRTSPVLADRRGPCADVAVLSSPAQPIAGDAVRIVVAADDGSGDTVAITTPSGHAAGTRVAHDGPPWSVVTTIDRAGAGTYRVTRDGQPCASVVVIDAIGRMKPERSATGAWASRLEWTRKTEALYAAWVEHLFAAPPDTDLSFPSLEPVLRDPARNFLYDHLGLGEDSGPHALSATPDCADLPYLLRAYFAWKVGLPFGFRHCGHDTPDRPPHCGDVTTNEDRVEDGGDALGVFARFARTLMDAVHSGSARTALDDDATDFYPVPLRRGAIRPGTIYADPYGHTLIAVGWLPQTAERPGSLLAVDAQPDNTVARKRFWEGTFLFVRLPTAGPGFKTFRPLVHDRPGGHLRTIDDDALAHDARFTPYSREQAEIDPETFYARMSALANPGGLEPERAYDATLDALVEQVETRVRSVDNGEAYMRAHPGTVVPMPEGAAIFETSGAWEDYATPSRDFRLIIAMKVLEALPERIVKHPELFLLGERPRDAARADVERLHASRIKERGFQYTRSDGSTWRLTVADALARKSSFETAYDPNDCVEVRWGAPEGSAEREPCKRRAPGDQAARMEQYREWFRESRRPAR
jgi:hypothetical protein